MPALLEIAVFHPESALLAQEGGADRIELCVDASVGGLSPDDQLLQHVIASVRIPVQVMVRPRGGDFVYTHEEFLGMCREIEQRKQNGVSGFVFGILTHDKHIDVERNAVLVNLAHPLPCTFHRAFDECANPYMALDQIIGCGFSKVLTSGLAPTALEGAKMLRQLVEKAGGRISIMPGGSVRSQHIKQLMQVTGAAEYHSSAILHGHLTSKEEVCVLKAFLGT